jgi:dihydrofolate reductase
MGKNMRKLLLQAQISIDGYVADNSGNTDWMVWNWGDEWRWDDELRKYHHDLTASVDCILLSRKMAQEGFIHHWSSVAEKRDNPQSGFARKITEAQKVVFTKTLDKSVWERTVLAKGDLREEIATLKQANGSNIIAYGGATFASSLLQSGLVDELHLLVNPTILGAGLSLFGALQHPLQLVLMSATSYPCGVAVLKYMKH